MCYYPMIPVFEMRLCVILYVFLVSLKFDGMPSDSGDRYLVAWGERLIRDIKKNIDSEFHAQNTLVFPMDT